MSSPLAIAAVTAVLKDLLNNGLIDHNVSGAVGGNINVTVLPPDRVIAPEDQQQSEQINLFLYQVTPNQGWRNVGLPSRNDRGDRLTNPPLALDLHYLLTAYSTVDFHSEILLGYAMQLLHETPILTRESIRKALQPPSPPVTGSVLPPAIQALAKAEDLADQVEQIKIIPESLNIEEISKIWSAFQTHYRPTTAYQVSVVLIESKYPTRSPLPVLSRGQPNLITGKDEGIIVQPNLLPSFPTLQKITPPNQQVAIRLGEVLSLSGHHLDGEQITVRFREIKSSRTLDLLANSGITATSFNVTMPSDPPLVPVPANSPLNPDNWPIAFYTVVGIIQNMGKPEKITNELSIALAPTIKSITISKIGNMVTLTVICSPKVGKMQRVSLVVGDKGLPANAITLDQTNTLTFQSENLVSGLQWVRLQVDGIDSILIDRSGQLPVFDPSQQVVIP